MTYNLLNIPPGLFSILLGLIIYTLPIRIIRLSSLTCAFIVLTKVIYADSHSAVNINVMNYSLEIFKPGCEFSQIFSTAFSLALIISLIYNFIKPHKLLITLVFIYAGASISILSCGDYISYFIFNEVMTIAAAIIIIINNKIEGLNYLKAHFLSGMLILAAICSIIAETGNISYVKSSFEWNITDILLISGILINAGSIPINSWLTNGYANAGIYGAVILPSFTTKAAIYSLINFYSAKDILIYIGIVMIFYGIIYAIIENNIYKILSYSLINQVGFMIVAIGIGTPIALFGAAGHAFCHIFYKILFYNIASIVVDRTGTAKCNEYNQLYKLMKIPLYCSIIAALSISAFPFTSGFISKSMIIRAAEEYKYLWLILTAASAGVFLHAGIKFPYIVFFNKSDVVLKIKRCNLSIYEISSLLISSSICIIIGVYPKILFILLENINLLNPYDFNHILNQLELLFSSLLGFYLFLPYLKRKNSINLDWDWFNKIAFSKVKILIFYFFKQIDELPINFISKINKYIRSKTLIFENLNDNSLSNNLTIILILLLLFTMNLFISSYYNLKF